MTILQPTESPRCLHFGECGGCRFQTIPYERQLLDKENFIKTLFVDEESKVRPILASDPFWHYRNKMEFSFSQSKKGEKFLGLMIRGKRGKVVNLYECHLTSSWFMNVLKSVRQWWLDGGLSAFYPPTGEGLLRTLTLREGVRTGEKMVVLTVSGCPSSFPENLMESFKKSVLKAEKVHSLVLRGQITQRKMPTRFEEIALHGQPWIHERLHDRKGKPLFFTIRPSSFFQPNTLQAEKLYTQALNLVQLTDNEILFDLYCGTATIGIFAASSVKQVIGVEINPDAVSDAKNNITLNQISNMEVWEGDVGKDIPFGVLPTTVVVDPPRAGLSLEAIKNVEALSPSKILYISCNPSTQVENIKEFFKLGYKIQTIQPVDQFPHTPHVENIVILTK